MDVKVNVSAAAGNALVLKDDGLYVDISGKADKVKNATAGNFAALDESGNMTDSGKKPADFVAAETGRGRKAEGHFCWCHQDRRQRDQRSYHHRRRGHHRVH